MKLNLAEIVLPSPSDSHPPLREVIHNIIHFGKNIHSLQIHSGISF